MKSVLLAVIFAFSLSALGQSQCSSASTWVAGSCSLPNVSLGALLAHASTTPVNIVVAGDSFTICDQTNCGVGPTTSTNRFPEQLRLALQSKYGSHGTGIVPIIAGFPAIINSEAWSCTAGWVENVTFGPILSSNGTLIQTTAGLSCTFHDARNIAWDTLIVYCATTSTTGALNVVIDGVSAGQACQTTSGSPTVHAVSLSSTSSTNHTVVITTSGGFGFLYGVEGTNGTGGVSVHNTGIGGEQASSLSSYAANGAFNNVIPGGNQVFLYMDETNDAAAAIVPATFSTNVQNIITGVKAAYPKAIISLTIPPQGIIAATDSFAAYTAAQKSLCKSNLLNCVSLDDAFGPYNSSSGLWDLSGTLWPSGNGGVHPNDAGNLLEYQLVNSVIQNNYAAVVF